MKLAYALAALAALALLAGPARANPLDNPGAAMPSIPDWEARTVQTLTGADGVPLSLGAPPANGGSCAINTQLGGQSSGSWKANGACAAGTIILTFASAAINGFECGAKDLTTPADTLTPSAYTTTTFTFSSVTMAASDLVMFSCRAF